MNQRNAQDEDINRPTGWLERPALPRLAYRHSAGRNPGIVFLSGYASDMTGTKAGALEAAARHAGIAFLRFDYRGHGQSEGRFEESTIGQWKDDALAIFDALTEGPQILVGSSMGGWIALLIALARPERVRAVVGIAAAPDFTQRLVAASLSDTQKKELAENGVIYEPSEYGPPLPFTRALIEDGRNHLLLDAPIPFVGKVRLLYGQRDLSVPWETGLKLAEALGTADVRLTFVKDGDHRLSRPEDIALLIQTVEELAGQGP